jgi:hypothetical protein
MYEVNIAADHEHFLDWDKPLSEQSQHVQAKIANLQARGMLPQGWNADDMATLTGHNVLQELQHTAGSSAKVSELLAAPVPGTGQGIAGIRYLDQGSRNVPATSYVVHAPSAGFTSTAVDDAATAQKWLEGYKQQFPDAQIVQQQNQQTHNHVVFDANTIAILRKYGIAGLIAGGGAAATAADGTQPPT